MGAGHWSRAAEWYAAGLLLFYVVLLFLHGGWPRLTDYANWSYQGVLLRDHLLGRADPAHALKPYPVPNSAATVGIGLLALLLPWKIAAKAWLCVQLGISFAALKHLLRTVGGSAAVWVIVPGAVFLNVNFWYGFMNFELGLCWVLLMASLLLRRARGEAERRWSVGVVLLLAFFTHMIPFALCGLMILMLARQTRRWRMLRELVPTGLLAGWYVVGRYLVAGDADGQAGMTDSVRDYSVAFWEFKVNSYFKSFGFVNPMGVVYWFLGEKKFFVLFCLNAAMCVLAGWAMFQAARRAYRTKGDERFIWAAVGIAMFLFLLAPGTALGISDPGARLLQAGLALGLVLCGAARTKALTGAAVCSVGVSMAGVYLFSTLGFWHEAVPHLPTAWLPRLVEFAHVPNDDQDYLCGSLDSGRKMDLKVFPTGMFLNK